MAAAFDRGQFHFRTLAATSQKSGAQSQMQAAKAKPSGGLARASDLLGKSGGRLLSAQGGNMSDRVIVEVDQDLSDLIPGFLARKRADVAAIFEAVGRRDYEEISHIAHRIKGEGGSYGFDAMTDMGRSMQQAAATRDDGAVTTLARQLLNYLDHLEIVFQPSKD
jgi:HPt (histidine-containing phosphotransfer) domain-containing protein